jgi:hypothetical protein
MESNTCVSVYIWVEQYPCKSVTLCDNFFSILGGLRSYHLVAVYFSDIVA